MRRAMNGGSDYVAPSRSTTYPRAEILELTKLYIDWVSNPLCTPTAGAEGMKGWRQTCRRSMVSAATPGLFGKATVADKLTAGILVKGSIIEGHHSQRRCDDRNPRCERDHHKLVCAHNVPALRVVRNPERPAPNAMPGLRQQSGIVNDPWPPRAPKPPKSHGCERGA